MRVTGWETPSAIFPEYTLACLVPPASMTVAVADSEGDPPPVKSSTFQSAGYLKDTWPFGKVYVFSSVDAGADDGVVPAEAAPPPAVAEGVAETDAVSVADAGGEDSEAACEDAEGVAETMAPQPASERAAAARAAMAGVRNAGRMMGAFQK